jgi:hypothetical protein
MCYYITATLPAEINVEQLRVLIDKHTLGFVPLQSKFVSDQLPKGSQYYRATKSYCDCADSFGHAYHYRTPSRQIDFQQHTAKLRKKGWSEEKIRRSLQDKSRALEKSHSGNSQNADSWLSFLHQILSTELISQIGLMTHFYEGEPETEHLSIKEIKSLKLSDTHAETMLNLEDDVLYVFRK